MYEIPTLFGKLHCTVAECGEVCKGGHSLDIGASWTVHHRLQFLLKQAETPTYDTSRLMAPDYKVGGRGRGDSDIFRFHSCIFEVKSNHNCHRQPVSWSKADLWREVGV